MNFFTEVSKKGQSMKQLKRRNNILKVVLSRYDKKVKICHNYTVIKRWKDGPIQGEDTRTDVLLKIPI